MVLRPHFSSVVSIEYVGKKKCFDLEVDSPYKNFVCENFIVHNSGRYVEFEAEIYIPRELRLQSKSSKQGSEGIHPESESLLKDYRLACVQAFYSYSRLVEAGVSKEQARAILPQNVFSECVVTLSLQAIVYLLEMRLAPDAQEETRQYAEAILSLMLPFTEDAIT